MLGTNLKSSIFNYVKNAESVNLEIDFGFKTNSDKVFDLNIPKHKYDKMLDYLLKKNNFKYKKDLVYYIYSYRNLRLFMDEKTPGKFLKCLKTQFIDGHNIYNSDGFFDLKITTMKKTPVSIHSFCSLEHYDNLIKRSTTSLNYNNQFYINFSKVITEKGITHHIKILLAKNISSHKSKIFVNLYEQIKNMSHILDLKLDSLNFNVSEPLL